MNHFGNSWGQWGHFGATPEAMQATEALTGAVAEIAAQQAERGGNQSVADALREWAPVVGTYVKQFQDPSFRSAGSRSKAKCRFTRHFTAANHFCERNSNYHHSHFRGGWCCAYHPHT